jgi:plasmid maintenance system antidote protein VapI
VVNDELGYRARYIGERVAEDQEAARKAGRQRRGPWRATGNRYRAVVYGVRGVLRGHVAATFGIATAAHIARHDPARELRGAEAKRAILAACTRAAEADPYGAAGVLALAVLGAMTVEWGHHPAKPFTPDWTLRPGVILIAEAVKARGWTPEDLAERAGLDPATARGLLDGSTRIDRPAAEGLARAIGTSAEMWLNAQRIYDAAILRGAHDSSEEHEHE